MPRSVVLVGYRATGKTTVGRRLANRLGYNFVDADRELELRHGSTVSQIFEDHGEPRFRDWEQSALEGIAEGARLRPTVVATGGGAVLREPNRAVLRSIGTVVWLFASRGAITKRLSEPGALRHRPALTKAGTLAEVETKLVEREPLYREVADLIVKTDSLSVEQVVEDVLTALRSFDAMGAKVVGDGEEPRGCEPRC